MNERTDGRTDGRTNGRTHLCTVHSAQIVIYIQGHQLLFYSPLSILLSCISFVAVFFPNRAEIRKQKANQSPPPHLYLLNRLLAYYFYNPASPRLLSVTSTKKRRIDRSQKKEERTQDMAAAATLTTTTHVAVSLNRSRSRPRPRPLLVLALVLVLVLAGFTVWLTQPCPTHWMMKPWTTAGAAGAVAANWPSR